MQIMLHFFGALIAGIFSVVMWVIFFVLKVIMFFVGLVFGGIFWTVAVVAVLGIVGAIWWKLSQNKSASPSE